MLFPPTLGFCMEHYFMSVQKHVHMGESSWCWIADTLEEYKPNKWKENDKLKVVQEAPLTPNMGAKPTKTGDNHPHTVATLGSALCNP